MHIRTSLLLSFTVLTLAFFPALAHAAKTDAASLAREQTVVQPQSQFDKYLAQYHAMRNAGKLLAARSALVKALRLIPEGTQKEELRHYLYNLNIRIFFSSTITPSFYEYTVKEGDTLGKIGRDNNTTIAMLKKCNNLESDTIYVGQKFKVMKAKIHLKVDKSANVLWLYADDFLVKKYRVATGKKNGTPVGTFTIDSKLENPTWFHAGAIVPSDSPENILGTRWMGFAEKKGYGIHGTTLPNSIGTQATAGCVRMKNNEIEELYTIVPYGTHVEIVD